MDNIETKGDKFIIDGEVLELGTLELEVIHTPGHTPGSICIKVEDMLFSGDTLFRGSIGRTDLYGGSKNDMETSLEKLSKLDEDLKVLPGHGSATTIAKEKKSNPFFKWYGWWRFI